MAHSWRTLANTSGDGRQQLTRLEGLDQVGGHAGVTGLLDQIALAEGGQDQHGHLVLRRDLSGRPQPVHARHLYVQNDQIRLMLFHQHHRLVAPPGLAHDVVAGRGQDLLEVEPDDGLVLGDDDTSQGPFPGLVDLVRLVGLVRLVVLLIMNDRYSRWPTTRLGDVRGP